MLKGRLLILLRICENNFFLLAPLFLSRFRIGAAILPGFGQESAVAVREPEWTVDFIDRRLDGLDLLFREAIECARRDVEFLEKWFLL